MRLPASTVTVLRKQLACQLCFRPLLTVKPANSAFFHWFFLNSANCGRLFTSAFFRPLPGVGKSSGGLGDHQQHRVEPVAFNARSDRTRGSAQAAEPMSRACFAKAHAKNSRFEHAQSPTPIQETPALIQVQTPFGVGRTSARFTLT